MKTLNDLMDRAKAAAGLTSDYKLAQHLSIESTLVYAWRAERRNPTPEAVLNLARMANESPAYWLLMMQARKTTNARLARRFIEAAEEIPV